MNMFETKTMGERIKGNPYVGRGIAVGMSADGSKAAIAYFIMGRSESSRNRMFLEKGDEIVIEPIDLSKVGDPSLIIYSPLRVLEGATIVTNGDQTDTVYDFLKAGKSFSQALATREFEPDAPNFTPRISALLHLGESFSYDMSILKSADEKGSACVREYFEYPALPGVGHFIHTYVTDGNPIPSFVGEPERIRIPDSPEAFLKDIWENLDEANKVAIAVRYIDLKSGTYEQKVINKYV
ncbi:MAG: IMP cyclohydrolase [Clostridia bacterium]|nr:IMP cyclohydrolase [Clostridia bacterium]